MSDPNGLLRIWLNPLDNNQVWPYLPITRTTFWGERQLWGMNLGISHGINVILHVMSGFLLWGLLSHFRIPGSWWMALLFVVHPIHVQSVAWIAERKNGVSILFYLLALGSFLKFYRTQNWCWYGVSLVGFVSALLSKTSTIMLPLLLLLLYVGFPRKDRPSVATLLPFFVIALIAGSARIWFELNLFGASGTQYELSFFDRLIVATHVPFFYLSKLVAPIALSFTYPRWSIDSTQWSQYLPLLSGLFSVGLLIWKYRSWGRFLLLGIVAFVVMLFPVSGWINNAWFQYSYVTDHWVHLPSLAFFLLVGYAGSELKKKLGVNSQEMSFKNGFLLLIGGGIVVALGTLTWHQVQSYRDEPTLWKATLRHNPKAWLAYEELGRLALDAGRVQEAIDYLTRSIELDPQFVKAYINRAAAFSHQQEHEKALKDHNQVLRLAPGYFLTFYNRGITHSALGKWENAFQDFSRVLEVDPSYAGAYFERGSTLAQQQKFTGALADFSKAIQLKPDHTEAYYNRALVYFFLQKYEQALLDLQQLLMLQPQHVEGLFNRGATYFRMQQYQKALHDFDQVLSSNSKHINAYLNRGLVHRQLGNLEQACLDWKHACELGKCTRYRSATQTNLCLDY